MKRTLTSGLAAVLLALTLTAPAAAADFKMGVIDVQFILNTSKRGQEAKRLLTEERDFRMQKLRERKETLDKNIADLDKRRAALSPEAFRKEQEKLLADQQQFGAMLQEVQGGLAQKEQELTRDIVEDVQQLVEQIAKKEGLDMVVEKSAVVYTLPKYDLTERVMKSYDSRGATGKK